MPQWSRLGPVALPSLNAWEFYTLSLDFTVDPRAPVRTSRDSLFAAAGCLPELEAALERRTYIRVCVDAPKRRRVEEGKGVLKLGREGREGGASDEAQVGHRRQRRRSRWGFERVVVKR